MGGQCHGVRQISHSRAGCAEALLDHTARRLVFIALTGRGPTIGCRSDGKAPTHNRCLVVVIPQYHGT